MISKIRVLNFNTMNLYVLKENFECQMHEQFVKTKNDYYTIDQTVFQEIQIDKINITGDMFFETEFTVKNVI